MRLDKFLSQQLGISRALVARELRAKRVTVDGEVVKSGALKLTPEMTVTFDGNVLEQMNGPRYFMLNKPQGYVCSTDDPDHPTVLYFLDEPVAYKLHAAGRLDIDTTGLVLMTDDGQWSHRITSPRHHCEKTYLVTLEQPLAADTAQRFAEGVQLHNEKDLTRPAQLEQLEECLVRLTISEGRYHQVKRMFAAVGNRVVELHRERIGAITLDEDLEPGEYRPLTEEEIASVGAPHLQQN
ncbi:16S rRNA pseudouridine(516) synthase RsuA [Serratia rhizosphaerae]|uniref:16S rRNA pseudouridine(516) synthase RsuA n=1 Tax=unclassified Serratia (in: enterobacteria) TaxID=2647522 RepID=UPI000CF60ED6|nr:MULTISPECIES: 16S rRNA pseudouridine(516) synthase RsuA [unclassified Serratia (in: enterobacteria)]MBU3892134.1 16S rRNA pseudouridine(516) synthase RsuA [Serratia rubidaea]AVJ18521.1 16S rRNA pseudouridine(516) synthase RsuA [Serratia sp. MYb239]MCA4822730.1 16S rRNA pseudouridine(516) synthase RsuA [Serratia rubidaea]QNK33984.1 16S rRNA pseudouridine(516) synthase RsuA [Serratia sp. JUb9]QPT12073.1 16S rRNA pseudouridine(516) synthase RsuA [Serratia rubidaea]